MADYKNLPLGLKTQTQIPLDVKQYSTNELLLSNLGVNGQLAYTYTKGLIVYCIEEGTRWEWKEVESGLEDTGLIIQDFIYPNGHIAFEIDYSNKRYNFFQKKEDLRYTINNIGSGVSIYKDSEIIDNTTQFNLKKIKSTDNTVIITEETDDIDLVVDFTGKATISYVDDKFGVNSIATAYVETIGDNATAQVGNSRKPFLTLDAALDALPSTGGAIKIGVGSFLSPTPAKIKSGHKFFGSGKPITNSVYTYTGLAIQPTITSPTKLVGGTILLGRVEVVQKDNVEFHDLGVDSGLDYCNIYNAGVANEGLVIAQQYGIGLPSTDGAHQLQTNSPPRVGIVVSNVSSLCKTATSPVHAMLIENTLNAKISNVSTYYGTHGLVIKSMGCEVNGLDAHGHASNGLIFKSNDYAYGYDNTVTNVYVSSIVGYDGGGINFVTGDVGFTTGFNNLSNFNVEFTKYGIQNQGAVEGINIVNGSIFNVQTIGINIDSFFINSTFSNIDQRQATTGILINQDKDVLTTLYFVNCKSAQNTIRNWDITANDISEVHLSNCVGQSSGEIASVINGNVYGYINELYLTIGTFKYDNSTPPFTIYSSHGNADADALLFSGGLYKLTGDRTVYQKP